MNDPERFLTRWSRRKRKAESPADSADADHRDTEQIAADPRESGDPVPGSGNERTVSDDTREIGAEPAKSAESEFDLSKLPPIESITAETDIRPFLAAGVPETLRQAALRRAWAVDPNIRDFIGLAENQWDFNAPGVPGFDFSPPAGDIKRMVAEIFGEKPDSDSQPAKPHADAVEATHEPNPPALSPNLESAAHLASHDVPSGEDHGANREAAVDSQDTSAPHAADTASQQKNAMQKGEAHAPRRSHGGAMPRQTRRP